MRVSKRKVVAFLMAGCFALASSGLRADPGKGEPGKAAISLAEFKKLHQQLQPPRDELWRTIPWQVSVLEARKLAARQKKPIIMRVRAGHPLGCV